MSDKGSIFVKAEKMEVAAEESLPLTQGRYVRITFSDDGPGIRSEIMGNIFDPFFSTREGGRYLISICRQPIKRW